MSVRLHLPREVDSVAAVRRLLRSALAAVNADRVPGEDLEMALSEACANVVEHARGAQRFEVVLDVGADRCTIDVLDDGAGFDIEAVGNRPPPAGSTRGRGLHLIRALAENVRMHSSPCTGSRIHFEKSFA